jgi:acetyl esterase/lipase
LVVVLMSVAVSLVATRAESDPEVDVVAMPDAAAARVATTAPTTTTTLNAPDAIIDGLRSPVLAPLARAATYRYGAAPWQLADVFVPETPATADGAPVIVYLHAGGWVAGARTDLPAIVAAQLARGWAVVSVDYALAPEHRFPEPVRDADLAVRWVRRHATALALRADTIVAIGASAGGHIASWLAANPDAHRSPDAELADVPSGVDAAVLLVAPVVMSDLVAHEDTFAPAILAAYLGCPEERGDRCTQEQLAEADPTRALGADPAPIYVLHGGLDTMFPAAVHGAALADAWRAAGVDARVEVAPFAGHNLDSSNVDVRAIEVFLDQAVATGRAGSR